MKLLLIEPRTLFPAHSGAKILSSNILRHLSNQHDVTMVVNVDPREPAENQEQSTASIPRTCPKKAAK